MSVQRREDGVLGVGAEWRVGGGRVPSAVGVLTRSAVQTAVSGRQRVAVTWGGGRTSLGVGVIVGPPEDPDLINRMESGLLGTCVLLGNAHSAPGGSWGDFGCRVLHPALFLSEHFV